METLEVYKKNDLLTPTGTSFTSKGYNIDEKDNIVPFPGISKKEVTGDYLINDHDDTTSSYNEIEAFRKQFNYLLDNIKESSYVKDKVKIELEVKKMETKLFWTKYYSMIWIISALIIGFFISSGISGLTGPFSTTIGILVGFFGGIGSFFDWRDRINNAS